jgi:hypothetical protein
MYHALPRLRLARFAQIKSLDTFDFAAQPSLNKPLVRFPITWNHVIDKESPKFKELEHVLVEKVEQLFRDML